MSLFSYVLEPHDVRREIGRPLMEEPFQTFSFNHDTVATWFLDDDEYDDVPTDQIREAAEHAREEHRDRHPSNIFRTTSRVMTDNKWSYWFEWEVTAAGDRARRCALQQQCCDDDGYVAEPETIKFWLERLHAIEAYQPRNKVTQMIEDVDWLREPWAAPIQQAIETLKDHVAISPRGEPDYDLTLTQFKRLTNERLLEFKNYFFSLNAEWARPIQEHIMVVFLSQPPKRFIDAA